MDNRRDLTKRLIADSFKALMCRYPFEKISIMMIATEADIRRPSFYNHFQDKYDLLEWIVAEDVIAPAREAIEQGKNRAALSLLFARLWEDAAFYRKAFGVTGQNGFEDSFSQRMAALFDDFLPQGRYPAPLDREDTARFYAASFVTCVRNWLNAGRDAAPDTLAEAYLYLIRHSFWDMETPTIKENRL